MAGCDVVMVNDVSGPVAFRQLDRERGATDLDAPVRVYDVLERPGHPGVTPQVFAVGISSQSGVGRVPPRTPDRPEAQAGGPKWIASSAGRGRGTERIPDLQDNHQRQKVPPVGIEPTTFGLKVRCSAS